MNSASDPEASWVLRVDPSPGSNPERVTGLEWGQAQARMSSEPAPGSTLDPLVGESWGLGGGSRGLRPGWRHSSCIRSHMGASRVSLLPITTREYRYAIIKSLSRVQKP